ncbi:uncharacterized protein BO72DRAFT_193846 [Aspergillus fijiensis CBS 313.89]|uniref:Uncharacterized protein n=1 Tax=Aspergillus fijiensis CBS 313.89 TaxID=1448319 RepID=A0A8G1RNR1_9EURO|nr:uncharacterized protein BO72DRAFT_193846 [Aspergillus fijiensis CBS 313.89]RAK74771.1 hypothetical protein BO72DRAFT_193846 [Aspergillus fijiensis CBS 313.89]
MYHGSMVQSGPDETRRCEARGPQLTSTNRLPILLSRTHTLSLTLSLVIIESIKVFLRAAQSEAWSSPFNHLGHTAVEISLSQAWEAPHLAWDTTPFFSLLLSKQGPFCYRRPARWDHRSARIRFRSREHWPAYGSAACLYSIGPKGQGEWEGLLTRSGK